MGEGGKIWIMEDTKNGTRCGRKLRDFEKERIEVVEKQADV
jgi:hypothetical protein